MTRASLCESCRFLREILSGKGSRFLLCRLSQTDRRFARYPVQPVIRCSGFLKRETPSEAAGERA